MNAYDDLAVCNGCGMRYPEVQRERCPVCDDPRQYVPPAGQTWSTLSELRQKHHNVFRQDEVYKNVWSIYSEPSFAIGQRAILIETPSGNILWDLITLLDQETVDFVKSVGTGELKTIIISHPHFYTTNRVWSEVFDCPVIVASEDAKWLATRPPNKVIEIHDITSNIIDSVTLIKCGGHFPGSLCLHYQGILFSSDTVMTVRSGLNPEAHQFEGTSSYSFMWSIPNMTPLDPKTIHQIWSRLRPFDFVATFGNIVGADVKGSKTKERMLQSAKLQVKAMGWEGKEEGELILQEAL